MNNISLHDINLENCILGCILLDCRDYIFILEDKDFTNKINNILFSILIDRYNKKESFDLLVLGRALKERGIENADDYLISLINSVSSLSLIESEYIPKLKDISLRRDLIYTLEEQKNKLLKESENPEVLKEQTIKAISKLKSKEIASYNLKDRVCSTIDIIIHENKYGKDERYFTGFSKLDNMTGGFQRGELILIAARPSMGKTALAMQIMINMAKRGLKAVFFSLEMRDEAIIKRMLSNILEIEHHKVRNANRLNKEEMQLIFDNYNKLSSLNIKIETDYRDIHNIQSYCRRNANNIDIIFIDYMGLIKGGKSEHRHLEIKEYMAALNEMKVVHNIPVVCLHQLSRDAENSVPTYKSLKESGATEEGADIILFLNGEAEERYNFTTQLDLIAAKNRNGSAGKIKIKFEKKFQRFYEFKLNSSNENSIGDIPLENTK